MYSRSKSIFFLIIPLLSSFNIKGLILIPIVSFLKKDKSIASSISHLGKTNAGSGINEILEKPLFSKASYVMLSLAIKS